jgi:Domain of unknown function (DUF4276)
VTRLIVVVEGQTEEAFINLVLKPHLENRQVWAWATIVGTARAKKRGRGGVGGGHYARWEADLRKHLRSNAADLAVTTLFDLYGLPRDFPDFNKNSAISDNRERCEAFEKSLGVAIDDRRLIPYIQRHEFEALVLASLSSLRGLLDAEDQLNGLDILERELTGTDPEDINDGPATAPSKRLAAHIPGYNKVVHGPSALSDTGLASLRGRCPRFSAWIESLETLGGDTGSE